MKLTSEQDKAWNLIRAWFKSAKPYFILGGFAGTGKTTLLKYIITELGSEDVLVCAPTWKAASVLNSKLGSIATCTTIHAILYRASEDPEVEAKKTRLRYLLETQKMNGQDHPDAAKISSEISDIGQKIKKKGVRFSLRDGDDMSNITVIVDEASMVTEAIHNDFIKLGARILYVGDPGQLPPVSGNGILDKIGPDFTLESIQRQALDSPIIRLSMEVRNGRSVPCCESPALRVLKKGQLDPKEWDQFDQIITGKNATRRKTNRYVRDLIGYKVVTPLAGDKLICLSNEEKFTEDEKGEVTMVHFINGGQAVLRENAEPFRIDEDDDLYLRFPRIEYDGRIVCDVTINCEPNYFKANYDVDYARAADVLGKASRNLNFDYAYAITVHKSQGSEWERVLLADDGMMFHDTDFRKRWLYTAVTRAKNHLTWIQAWQG